jgi:hypothetical protein
MCLTTRLRWPPVDRTAVHQRNVHEADGFEGPTNDIERALAKFCHIRDIVRLRPVQHLIEIVRQGTDELGVWNEGAPRRNFSWPLAPRARPPSICSRAMSTNV